MTALSAPGIIRTYTGRTVNLLAPTPADVDLRDIAHALSNECRFSGHTSRHYSVAEHALFVADLVTAPGVDPRLRLCALLHDATEAYLKDLPKPLKLLPQFAPYLELEARWAVAIGEHFGVALEPLPEPVKLADKAMLVREQQLLMGRAPQPHDGIAPAAVHIEPGPPHGVEQRFLRAVTRCRMEVR